MVTALATCSVCTTPYAPVSDDPSPAHPGCAPSDRERYEAATRGPRTYTGRSRPALHEAGCRGCGGWITVNELVSLADVDGTGAWVHDGCAFRASAPSAAAVPPIALADARESRKDALRAGNDHESATRRTA